MNKCFITKLPSSIDNDNLPSLGQLRIKWLKQNNLKDNASRCIVLATNDSITVKVSGAHFTDSTLTGNVGNTKIITAADGNVSLYVSNDTDAVLTIDNKYSLTRLSFAVDASKYYVERSASFDIEDIKYCTNLTMLMLINTQVSGDISALSKLINLTALFLDNTNVSGDISALSKIINLTSLSISSFHVSGDISALSKLTNINYLILSGTQVSGDISALSKLINLTDLSLNNTQVSGDLDNLSGLNKLTSLENLKNLSLTGDMSKIPVNVMFISQYGRKINTNFTWTTKGRQNAKLLAIEGAVPFDTASMDNMLIDQATCTFKSSTSKPWYNVLDIRGTRTSASDAAVTTLQNMGVTITGVAKAS